MHSNPGWRWPVYRDTWLSGAASGAAAGAGPSELPRPPLLPAIASASFVEWRYFAVLAPEFHGMVGLSILNPEQRFPWIAEGGLLLLLAGRLDALADTPGDGLICWMHRFALDDCRFDEVGPGALEARDDRCRLSLVQPNAAEATLAVHAETGLALRMTHRGLAGTACAPVQATGLDGPLSRLLGSHWHVDCPSPMARCDGELELPQKVHPEGPTPGQAGEAHGAGTGDGPTVASAHPAGGEQAAGRQQSGGAGCTAHGKPLRVRWRQANGYAEHSFGVRPLPLQGWDFLFVPRAETGEAVVLQTYLGSRVLRYLEVFWREGQQLRSHRFNAHELELDWPERVQDPVLGVARPLRRRIRATSKGLRVQVDNRVLQRIPLLRPQRLAVRHFFISEEIGVADWRLEDAQGRCLAEVQGQPCGGELAHVRLRTPRVASPLCG